MLSSTLSGCPQKYMEIKTLFLFFFFPSPGTFHSTGWHNVVIPRTLKCSLWFSSCRLFQYLYTWHREGSRRAPPLAMLKSDTTVILQARTTQEHVEEKRRFNRARWCAPRQCLGCSRWLWLRSQAQHPHAGPGTHSACSVTPGPQKLRLLKSHNMHQASWQRINSHCFS